jgi:hypothetical protein
MSQPLQFYDTGIIKVQIEQEVVHEACHALKWIGEAIRFLRVESVLWMPRQTCPSTCSMTVTSLS